MPVAKKKATTRKANFLGFGGGAVHSSIGDAENQAYDAGSRIQGDLKRFKGTARTHYIDQQFRKWAQSKDLAKSGRAVTKSLQHAYKAGATGGQRTKKVSPAAAKAWAGKQISTFEASNIVKDIAKDQGYGDARRDYNRNLSTDEIPEYISGHPRSKIIMDKLGKGRVRSIYSHEYREGQKKYRNENKREKARSEKSKREYEAKDREEKPKALKVVTTLKGVKIYKLPDGDFTTSIDKDSHFDSLKDAKDFIVDQKSNPAKPTSDQLHQRAVAIAADHGGYIKESTLQRQLHIGYGAASKLLTQLKREGHANSSKSNPAKSRLIVPKQSLRSVKSNLAIAEQMRDKARVKAILAKAKATGRQINAYAICTAAGTRNPAEKNWQVVWYDSGAKKIIASGLTKLQAMSKAKSISLAAAREAKKMITVEKANPKIHRPRGKVGKRRPNPEDGSEQAYKEFTGHDPSVTMEIEEKIHVHRNLWTVGKLIAFDIITVTGKHLTLPMPGFTERRSQGKPYWDFDESLSPADTVWLTANEKYKDDQGEMHAAGSQLFVKGGDQSIDLASLGMDPLDEKENTLIGTIEKVWYRQKKKFEGKAEVDFHHAFGKEGSKGILPILLYHPRSEHMTIAGGRYQIAKPEGALGNVSPGIIG